MMREELDKMVGSIRKAQELLSGSPDVVEALVPELNVSYFLLNGYTLGYSLLNGTPLKLRLPLVESLGRPGGVEEQARLWPALDQAQAVLDSSPEDLEGLHSAALALHTWLMEHPSPTSKPAEVSSFRGALARAGGTFRPRGVPTGPTIGPVALPRDRNLPPERTDFRWLR